jgi:hypothetical protein
LGSAKPKRINKLLKKLIEGNAKCVRFNISYRPAQNAFRCNECWVL